MTALAQLDAVHVAHVLDGDPEGEWAGPIAYDVIDLDAPIDDYILVEGLTIWANASRCANHIQAERNVNKNLTPNSNGDTS